ncbi:MAG TPA: MOSC domain-containing protein [Actinomycetota bacterium]|nr:MOSC domain-containing protein [Actinomycetota bacterium]
MGTVETIVLAGDEGAPCFEVREVAAHAGRGLEGDRYFEHQGKMKKLEPARQATLIEAEALEAAARDYDEDIHPTDARRNIVTRGVALNHLVGKTFRVGDATLRGIKLCEPCGYLQKLSGKQVKVPLKHRGGLNAEITVSGTIRAGDAIVLVEREPAGTQP